MSGPASPRCIRRCGGFSQSYTSFLVDGSPTIRESLPCESPS
jgi:hypothetical protein